MELIPVNMQMGLSTLDVNQRLNRSVHGFWFSQKLIFCYSTNMKKASPFGLYNVRPPICAIANHSIDDAFLEKDFTFEPTFEGYLEAMEIARTGRDKKLSRDASGRRFKKNGGWVGNDDVSRFESNGYEENADFVDGYPRQNFDSVVRVKHGNSEKTSDSYGNSAGTGRVWTRSKVGCRERVGDFRDLNVVKRSPGSRDLERRDMGCNGSYAFHGFEKRRGEERTNYADTGKKELRPNGRWIRNQINTVEKKTGGSESNKTLLEMESLHRRMDGNKRGIFLRNRQSSICEIESDRRERTTTYHSGTRNRWQGDAAKIDDLTLGSIKLETRSRRSDFQTERSVSGRSLVKSQDSRKPTRVLRTEVEGSNPDMERKAFKTFEVFTDVRNRPRVLRMEMEERIQNLAKWLNGTSVYLSEWQFSKMMHSADIKFTDHSILRVVQILGELGNWRRVLQVVQWLQSRERFKSYKSKYIYTTVLNVLGKARRPVEALNVFRAMRQELSSYPDMAAYHCIAVTLGQVGYMKELFDVIDCMRSVPEKLNKRTIEKWDPRLEPDAVVYNAVLNACVLRKQWEGAFWVLQQLEQQDTRPSSTTYGLVMEVMLACGKYNLVHEFFRKVEKSSIPNTLTYKVLVNALWREGKTDEAVLAVQDMERRGIVGSASLYYDLARCLCSAGRCQEALTQVDKLCKVATKPLLVTYTGLIKACLDSGNVKDGAYIFNHMHKFCSPNLITYNTMLRSYVQHKMFKEAMDLFEKILNGGGIGGRRKRPLPEHFTFNTMLEACAVEKRWDDFDNIYRRMLHHGYVFDAKHHLSAILAASRAGKGQLLYTTWDHLVRSNRVIPTAIVKEMFCLRLQEDDIPAAISCLSYQPNVLPAFSEEAWLELFSRNADRFQKETLVALLHEVSAVINENDKSNTIFVNLVNSCREVLNANV